MAVGDDTETFKRLIEAMRAKPVTTLWLGLQKRKLHYEAQRNTRCPYFDIRDRSVSYSGCNSNMRTRAFICEGGCMDCRANKDLTSCLHVKETCYQVHCRRVKWHMAQERCEQSGGQLYMSRDKQIPEEIIKEISHFHEKNCRKYWIQEANDIWIKASTTLELDVSATHWLDEEPSYCPKCDCVILTDLTAEVGWRAVPCSRSHAFICDRKNDSADFLTLTQRTDKKPTPLKSTRRKDREDQDYWKSLKSERADNNTFAVQPRHIETDNISLIIPLVVTAVALVTGAVVIIITKLLLNHYEQRSQIGNPKSTDLASRQLIDPLLSVSVSN